MKRSRCCFVAVLLAASGMAQADCLSSPDTSLNAPSRGADTLVELSEFEIRGDRIETFAKGLVHYEVDSLTRTESGFNSLADMLRTSATVHIKSYGPGQLSTIAFRGTSSNHTGLVWNGLRVNPPNIGYLDLSLIASSFFQEISIMHGGASPMYGSGIIGGSIHLTTRPSFEKKTAFKAGGSFGSFSSYDGLLNATVSGNRIFSYTSFSAHSAMNDFPYSDLSGNEKRLTNASTRSYGVMQEFAVKSGKNDYFQASFWFNQADREIPPTMTTSDSDALLFDRSARAMLQWKHFAEKSTYTARAAYFNEFERYSDPAIGLVSEISTQSLLAQVHGEFIVFPHSRVFGGLSYTYDYALIDAYESPEDQQTGAVYASWSQLFPKAGWSASLNLRAEVNSDFNVPFLPSVGAEGDIGKNFKARVNMSGNFRAPTLNDRYWVPGGNPDLRPETSWNQEIGLSHSSGNEKITSDITLTLFNSVVDNWILWVPEGSVWGASNVQKVWSRGLEVQGVQHWRHHKWQWLLSEGYTWARSTNEKKTSDNDASYKKQLIYTPEHRLYLKFNVLYRDFNLMIRQNITSSVYTTRDNEDYLPGFGTTDIQFSKNVKFKGGSVEVQLLVNNLFNTEYQVVRYRPMPGRYGSVKILIGIEPVKQNKGSAN